MSTNLEYIERETSEAQRDQKKSERARAREKTMETFLLEEHANYIYIIESFAFSPG